MNLTLAQKVRLGIFVFLGTALFAGAMLSLLGLKFLDRRDRYTVRFAEEVGGLEISAPVKYQGLRVGRVDDLMIAPDDPTTIEVVLVLDPRTILYQGTTAVLDRSGLTGLKTINLTPGSPDKPRLTSGSQIPAGQSFMDKLTGQAEQIAVKVELIANQLAHWTNQENRLRAEKLVESLTALSSEVNRFLATNRDPIREALVGIARLSGAAASLTEDGNQSLKFVRDEVHQTLEETRITLREIRRPLSAVSAEEVNRVVVSTRKAMQGLEHRLSDKQLGLALDGMQKSMGELTRLIQSVDLAVRAGREDLIAALSNLRQAAEDVREFSRIIAQDPSAVLRGKE